MTNVEKAKEILKAALVSIDGLSEKDVAEYNSVDKSTEWYNAGAAIGSVLPFGTIRAIVDNWSHLV